ncbi:MAG: thymidine phosphorylase [Candidatus Levybacteria bacterium]|nr:thymidine phosphorylase [Candidatus Levybacteria bacterium]
MDEKHLAINAIRKKLLGKDLSYEEIYAIMDEISKKRFGDILTTYFAASGYSKGFTNQELYYLTKAMVETGERLEFEGIVADKHSIGGVPATRTTPIVVSIIAAAGFKIPKSSSRAITSPDGTADDMEVLAPVKLSKQKIIDVVNKTNGCIVWGGSFHLAPADDIIIQVEKPLLFESYDKVVVSIMAKKIAFGSNHIVIDLPYGKHVKVHTLKDAKVLSEKFEYLAKRFKIKIKVLTYKTDEPAGRGVGPVLEIRDSLKVLEQTKDRPIDLEVRSLTIATALLELCFEDSQNRQKMLKDFGNVYNLALTILQKKIALEKFKQIIKAQGGNPNTESSKLKLAKNKYEEKAVKPGIINELNIKNITHIAKILGAPEMKASGIYLNKKIGESVEVGDVLYTLFSEKVYNLKEGKDSLKNFPIVLYE